MLQLESVWAPARFKLKARINDGRVLDGTILAASRSEVADRLGVGPFAGGGAPSDFGIERRHPLLAMPQLPKKDSKGVDVRLFRRDAFAERFRRHVRWRAPLQAFDASLSLLEALGETKVRDLCDEATWILRSE